MVIFLYSTLFYLIITVCGLFVSPFTVIIYSLIRKSYVNTLSVADICVWMDKTREKLCIIWMFLSIFITFAFSYYVLF